MRTYYEDPYRYSHHHHHYRSNVEIDIFPRGGGPFYSPSFARPEVVVVTPAANYVPMASAQVIVQPQPYGAPLSMGSAAYYQQQQGYQYQYQQYNNPPYSQW